MPPRILQGSTVNTLNKIKKISSLSHKKIRGGFQSLRGSETGILRREM